VRFCLLAVFLSISRLLTVPSLGAPPAVLNQAIQKLLADQDHWAYTQTVQRFDKNGNPIAGTTIERYDPSRPYNDQWELVSYQGHLPTDADVATWRRQKFKQIREHEQNSFGNFLDLDHATLAGESATTATFLVPMQDPSKRLPADKLQVFMDVDKTQNVLTAFSVQPRDTFTLSLVLKVDSGRIDGRLNTVQPNYAPTLVWLKAAASGRFCGLIKIGRGAEVRYSDFRRVRPYSDRFEVIIRDLRVLDF
jgi:hypothetical protein